MAISLKRVAVTGLGVISPLGLSCETTWRALLENKCAIKSNTFYSSKISASIDAINFSHNDRIPRFAKMALIAAEEAVRQSGLSSYPQFSSIRSCVAFGSGFGDIKSVEKSLEKLNLNYKTRLNPYIIPCGLIDSAAVQISLKYGLKGPCMALSAACATSSHNIGAAFSFIQSGRADFAISGAAESTKDAIYIHAGFAACKALATTKFSQNPDTASRPFDCERNGFVISEGAAVLVLENMDIALKRGARILAEVVGHGATSDAYHLTAPHPNGEGAIDAMNAAIKASGMKANDLSFVVAHASSTTAGDATESAAIKTVFGKVPVCAFKGHYGHTLAASGAIDACMGIMALQEECFAENKKFN